MMMISPESFYKCEVKGKTAPEILTVIRGLKRDISRNKRIIESNMMPGECLVIINPDPAFQLSMERDYLEMALKAYAEAGGEYHPTAAELRALEFERNIYFISQIDFYEGGYFMGYPSLHIEFSEDNISVSKVHSLSYGSNIIRDYPLTRRELLDGLRECHLGEWKGSYFNHQILDGTQWGLDIRYSNGKRKKHFSGSNQYPWSYENFKELIAYDHYCSNSRA